MVVVGGAGGGERGEGGRLKTGQDSRRSKIESDVFPHD